MYSVSFPESEDLHRPPANDPYRNLQLQRGKRPLDDMGFWILPLGHISPSYYIPADHKKTNISLKVLERVNLSYHFYLSSHTSPPL